MPKRLVVGYFFAPVVQKKGVGVRCSVFGEDASLRTHYELGFVVTP
jgi:hypothetical protein